MNDPRVHPLFKRSRHNILYILAISQDYYEIPKGTIRAFGDIYHIFKPKISEILKIFTKTKHLGI